MQQGGNQTPQAARLPAAAALLAASVLLSRFLGYLRDAVLANRVGVGPEADAYNGAFQIPDLLNYFLAGGALSIAFLPYYARLRARHGEEAAERFFATVLGTLGTVALAVTAVLWIAAPEVVPVLFPGWDPDTHHLTTRLTRIVLPAQILFVTGGILQATLLARGRFGAQALAPLLYNGAIIAGGLFLAPHWGVEGFAWGVLVGALLGPFAMPLLDARHRVPLRLRVAFHDRDFLRYLVIAAPLMVGVTLLTVDEWYDRLIGNRLGVGAVAELGYARRLMQLPVGVVGQAIGTALLPTLAHLWAERRSEEVERVLDRTLRAGLGIAVLAAAGTWALARPIVELLYHHGAFTAEDAEAVAALLRLFAFAVPAWVGQQIIVRAFYARGDMWRPMALGTGFALAMAPLYIGLGQRLGVPGLALAGAVGMSGNALATLALARRLHGAPHPAGWIGSLARAGGIGAVAALVARAAVRGSIGPAGALADLAVGGLLFVAVAGIGVVGFGDAPLRDALRRLPRRLRPGKGDS